MFLRVADTLIDLCIATVSKKPLVANQRCWSTDFSLVLKNTAISNDRPGWTVSRYLQHWTQALWKDLLSINSLLSVRPENLTPEHAANFETRSREFVKEFTALYPSKHVTPYIPCMMMHISEFMPTQSWCHCTINAARTWTTLWLRTIFVLLHTSESFQQVLQKQNEFLEDSGDLQKLPRKGHNKLSCTKPCVSCTHSIYRTHVF